MKLNANVPAEKVLTACTRFLEKHGYEEVQEVENPVIDLLAFDEDGTAVLCALGASEDDLEEEEYSRREMEDAMAELLVAGLIDVDTTLRFDVITLRVFGDKALLKHHINALGAA